MKFLFMIAATSFLLSCSETTDLERERAAVLEVIERETNTYFQADFNGWKDCFLDTTYFNYIGYWDGYHATKGIVFHDDYDTLMNVETGDFDRRKTTGKGWNYEVTKRHDMNIQVSGNLAYATFTEVAFDKVTKEYLATNFGIRILEKRNGEWKIAQLFYYFFPDDVRKFNIPLTVTNPANVAK